MGAYDGIVIDDRGGIDNTVIADFGPCIDDRTMKNDCSAANFRVARHVSAR